MALFNSTFQNGKNIEKNKQGFFSPSQRLKDLVPLKMLGMETLLRISPQLFFEQSWIEPNNVMNVF